MPSNETNPYPAGHPLNPIFETASADAKAALMAPFANSEDFSVPNLESASPTPPAKDPYVATTWGQPDEQDFRCPSGQLCRVRRVDILDLMGDGLLNQLDSLTGTVNAKHIQQAQSGRPQAAIKAMSSLDPKAMAGFRKQIAAVVVRVVVAPEVFPVPENDALRVVGRVYVDSISFFDQVAIFNWAVTGKETEALHQFRDEASGSVGDLEYGENVSESTVELPAD